MIFWSFVFIAIVYLLLVGFAGSQLMAWWGRSMDRKTEEKHLREFAAAKELGRYYHKAGHSCGLLGETNLIHIDVRCIEWTLKVNAAIAELMRAKRRAEIREALRKLTERKLALKRNEPGVTRAQMSRLN